jgi:hypothetical protein
VSQCSGMSPETVRGELYVPRASSLRSQRRGRVMRCQHVDDDTQCRMDATRRVLIGGGDPPDPDQAGLRGPSTWSRSARSTTPTPGGRCRCRVLPVPCRSANVRGGSPGSPVRVSDGSPRPTCASTATRWPRTPTTVTPVTFRERTCGLPLIRGQRSLGTVRAML